MISHDRWFLDRIATHVLAFEGDSQVRWFEGNFTEYEEYRHSASSAPPPTSRTASSTRSSLDPPHPHPAVWQDGRMCVNCMSNAEAAVATAAIAGYLVKEPVHRALAAAGLAPDPDPVAHDVRTVAFLRGLDLDPVEVLGADVVAQAESWTPDTSWVPFRDRLRAASARPIGSQSLLATQ